MRVGHGIGCFDDARQRGDVCGLLVDLIVHVADQVFVGIDDRRHAHRAVRLDAPGGRVDARKPVRIHHWLRYTSTMQAADQPSLSCATCSAV